MNDIDCSFRFAVIGGDERQIYCGTYLADRGYEVLLYGFDNYSGDIGLCKMSNSLSDAVVNSNIIILPILNGQNGFCFKSVYSENEINIREICNNAVHNALIFAGRCSDKVKELFNDSHVRLFDYFEREELITANAYLTAESAITIASENCKFTLNGATVLVMGYGRIGKMLCHLLKARDVNVFASARKRKDFEWIRAFGYSSVDTSNVCDVVSECRIVFNTIPNLVLGEKEIHCMPKDCLIIDLASKPGGVDFDAAKKLGLKVIWALGLPGKHLPYSAGKVVGETVLNIIEDEVSVL